MPLKKKKRDYRLLWRNVFPPYKGGDTAVRLGYIVERLPGHHLADAKGWVQQHRLVAEDKIGRRLVWSNDAAIGEDVHHRDHCRTNNHPDNLVVLTRVEHVRYHGHFVTDTSHHKVQVTREQAERALGGRTIAEAAELLGIHHMTIRNRFPDLIEHMKRRPPSDIDDQFLVREVRSDAADENVGIRTSAKRLGISPVTVMKIAERHGIQWTRQTKAGEVHTQYVRKKLTLIEDPAAIAEVARLLEDKNNRQSDVARLLGIGKSTVSRIAKKIDLSHRSRKGEAHETYRKKPTRRSLELHAEVTESV